MGLAINFKNIYDRSLTIKLGAIELPAKKKVSRKRQKYAAGVEYETISDVLSDLDNAFSSLKNKKLQKMEKQVLRNLGAFMYSQNDTEVNTVKADISDYGLPAIMPIICNLNDDSGERYGSVLMIFRKYKNQHFLEPVRKDSALYEVSYFYASKDKSSHVNKKSCSTNFFCEISKHGDVRQLKHLETNTVRIKGKRGTFDVPQRQWIYQPTFSDKEKGWVSNSETGKREAAIFFNIAMWREMNVNVTVTNKEGYKIVFLVPMHRWKYFFKDRIDVNVNGRKTKIFHYCSAHTRKTKNGVSYVRAHTKGSRHFSWGDYGVSITLPGKHGISLASFDVAPETFYSAEDVPTEGYIGHKKVCEFISEAMEF